MALEDGGYELQIRRPLDAVGWGAVAGAAVLCLLSIALTPILSWSSLVCFVIVPLCTLFVWARRVRTGRVEDGVLVLRDFGGEVRHLEVGRFVPRLEDGVLSAEYPDGSRVVIGVGAFRHLDDARRVLQREEPLPLPAAAAPRAVEDPNSPVQRRETRDGYELELSYQRSRWVAALWLVASIVLLALFLLTSPTWQMVVWPAYVLGLVSVVRLGWVCFVLGPRSLMIRRNWPGRSSVVPYDAIVDIRVFERWLSSKLVIELADGSTVETRLGARMDHLELAEALRQRQVADPVAGPPPELAALRQTVDER